MRSEKESRVSRAKDLRARDQHLCDVLCATPFYIPSGAVASQDQLRALEEHIRNLEKEKVSIGSHDDYLQALYVLIVIAQLYFAFALVAGETTSHLPEHKSRHRQVHGRLGAASQLVVRA